MTRTKVQNYELFAQCLITRDAVKGYSISRWFQPATGYEFSTESNTTEVTKLQDDAPLRYMRSAKTRVEKKDQSNKDNSATAAREAASADNDVSVSETYTEGMPDFASPISNAMALQILDELPLIGSPVPDHPLSFMLESRGKGREYIVHVKLSRSGDRDVQIWQEWYARRKTVSLRNMTLVVLFFLGLVALSTILFISGVGHLPLKKEEPKEPVRPVREVVVEKTASPPSKSDPELSRSRNEIQSLQKQMSAISAAVESFRSFPTNRLYKPRVNLLNSSCTLEEKLREFFSQEALVTPLDKSEVQPWIAIEWRGAGSAPDIDRIFLTNQDGKSLRDLLSKIGSSGVLVE
ncbi:MAG: hypothetical protein PHQ75_03830 [Thermoguttaceae bacterium]|nr:hypothetical protein [Thermoguttaceae bacterium]